MASALKTLKKAVNTMSKMQPTYTASYYSGSYKPTEYTGTYNAQHYTGPTYQASQYKSNYTPTEFKNNYQAQQYNDTYNPEQYQSKYMPQIEDTLNKVTNWSYDPMQDASYKALASVYAAKGNQAAKNTLGDAAALNGGYGTSYAVSAAQQARNQYNQELASYIPQLEQNAYQRAQTSLDALQNMDNSMYNRFSDDQTRQLQSKQFGLDVEQYNEANRQFAANLGLDYDKLNNEEKRFVEQNAQNVWSMNNDERYRAAQNALDIFGVNTGIDQFAANYGLDVAQFNEGNRWNAAQFDLDTYLANQGERQFGYKSQADNATAALQNAYDYLAWKEAQKGGSGGGGGGGRRSGGGGSYGGGGSTSSGMTAQDLLNAAKNSSGKSGAVRSGSIEGQNAQAKKETQSLKKNNKKK